MVDQRKNIKDNVSEQKLSELENQSTPNAYNSGFYNDNIVEAQPLYNRAPSEKVIFGSSNTFIILGRDRPRGKSSGYGGSGHTHAGCIDIVAGMTGIMCREVEDGIAVVTDKSPELDAARIYISQKADIDDYFQLTAGNVGNPKGRSGIAIKADSVRIIGREGIKLVTSTDLYNSPGVNIEDSIKGIDLIAGNEDSGQQPLVKGDDLQVALYELCETISDLNGLITNYMMTYATLLAPIAVGSIDPATKGSAAAQVVPMGDLVAQLQSHQLDLFKWANNYVFPWGEGYINSLYNTTN
jgi:hypothetical protein|tara:strand:- start:94 stop:984 length:891 start_codon:yes stop_codon:yes gene_type:complete